MTDYNLLTFKAITSFVNDLSDFCPLLEMIPKKDYKQFMKSYGESQILHNISSIQHIEKIHQESVRSISKPM